MVIDRILRLIAVVVISEKGPVFSLYTNSPGGPPSPGMSVREISSPFRVMSLNSPVSSPLGALMQSPQLAQKVRKDTYLLLETTQECL